jgi:small subunit ribosomal protein S1
MVFQPSEASGSMSQFNPVVPDAEDQAVRTDDSFGDILTQFEQEHRSEPGEALQGRVVGVTPEAVYVDIGRKMEGVLPPEAATGLKPGDSVLVAVTGVNSDRYYTLSTIRVERPKDWTALETAFNEKRIIAGQVTEMVKGGFRVDVGVPAFMPASRSGVREMADMEQLVGKDVEVRITKLEVADEDVVVDRRSVLEEREKQVKEEAFSRLQEGAVVKGVVRSLTEFGAFVDLGGVDGLLHISDMSWHRVSNPADVLSAGDDVELKILKINPATRKISLGLKQLTPEPWEAVPDKYRVGDRIKGKVVRLADFGAFVELEPGIDGLIHVSELSWSKKARRPEDVVKVGDAVEVVVLGVNPKEKRISLGLKQALGDPWEEAEKKYTPGDIVEGTITSLQKFGAFVELDEAVEGMIHIADISREKRLEHPKEALQAGQRVRAQVLEVDRQRRRIRLGLKQLEPTSVDHYIAEHREGDTVTGRVVDITATRARVELGDGVFGTCLLKKPEEKEQRGGSASADVSTLGAMLSAKWKSGPVQAGGPDGIKPGQIRNFRITLMDASAKRIEVEVAN